MNIITISREFGSGGRELGKRLADHLGYDYYDSEIIAAVAKNSGMDADYIRTLGDDGWQQYPITFRSTLGGTLYTQSNKVQLLLEQKRVIEGIAALGKDCIIVGRNADVLLKKYQPFNIFVCAETETKLKRSLERAPEGEQLTEKQLRRKLKKIDKARAQTRALLSSSPGGQRKEYHLTVNTTGWEIKKMVPAVADFAMAWFGRME